ncbi:PAS domain-containing protein [Tunicatimonas pelagia]|uniref:PAS domain-containing protein n=1 Tax=Tunicatimonas pelagia TaxID=931531 RepID=UPI0026650E7D|nr:PAS domain-containing protein [Tunicatimonas pelagia]WKN44483.1 PAS domain-containing protein [Tunicatimonas pelagia]
MNEQERIQDLLSYEILGTSPERELDELVEIASVVCNTPISLITLIDQDRQWCKSKMGIDMSEIPREHSFCHHALSKPNEVLVVEDPVNDTRFKDTPFVVGEPYIRFYAGAPLQTPKGNILGTLCVLDNKPNEISESQKKALSLLAKRAIDFMDTRKVMAEQSKHIRLGITQLKNLTDQVPGIVYQFRMTDQGAMSFDFLSRGVSNFYPDLEPEDVKQNVQLVFDLIHPEDLPGVMQKIKESFQHLTPFYAEYRVLAQNGAIRWLVSKSTPEKLEEGAVVWYGIFQDVTKRKEYEQTLEQISFDISHVIRRPISSLLGLVALSESENVSAEQLKEYVGYTKIVADELDEFTRKLHDIYYERKTRV